MSSWTLAGGFYSVFDTSDANTLSLSSLNSKIDAIDDYIDTEVSAIKAKTDNLPASPAATSDIPTANQNADALLDRANAIESGRTVRGSFRLMLAALTGKLSGATSTSISVRDTGDSKNRLVVTVDGNGNRTAVTYDDT